MNTHASQLAAKQRFAFGANWQRFLDRLTPTQIDEAERSLVQLLNLDQFTGLTFLDIGSGSGLFSLAARNLGARVHSFDFDPQSVACTRALRARYFPDDSLWTIDEASVLDPAYLSQLGPFDVVYSWGVLHHTGHMWQALDNALIPLAPGGRLAVALYNHQPLWSPLITLIKRGYVASPRPLRALIAAGSMTYHAAGGLVLDVLRRRNPLARYQNYNRLRGMSWWYDQLDWIGGYPFETATPTAVSEFYTQRGLQLERLLPARAGSSGCNQFVFRRATKHA